MIGQLPMRMALSLLVHPTRKGKDRDFWSVSLQHVDIDEPFPSLGHRPHRENATLECSCPPPNPDLSRLASCNRWTERRCGLCAKRAATCPNTVLYANNIH